jgi:predicted component of type VI protein secretion system
MSPIRTLLLTGIATAGLATAALSQTMHEETIQLGPNAVEHIYYTGDAAPQVSVTQSQPGDAMLAAMVQQQDAMAAQAQQMLQQAAALLNAPMAVLPAMPVLTAMNPGTACVTSMSFEQVGDAKPQVTEYRSPGCGNATPAPVQPTELKPAIAPAAPTPQLIQARLATPQNEVPSG